MVHELRKRDGIKELSLVAETNNQLIGHIICSNARIETPD
jgi:predicted N-acetyltransferase YhbS